MRSISELGHLSPREHRSLLKACGARGIEFGILRRSLVFALMLGGAAAATLGALELPELITLYAVLPFFIIGLVLLYQVQFIRIRGRIRLTMAKELRGARSPVCVQCGYDATGNASDRCAECNASLFMRVE